MGSFKREAISLNSVEEGQIPKGPVSFHLHDRAGLTSTQGASVTHFTSRLVWHHEDLLRCTLWLLGWVGPGGNWMAGLPGAEAEGGTSPLESRGGEVSGHLENVLAQALVINLQ